MTYDVCLLFVFLFFFFLRGKVLLLVPGSLSACAGRSLLGSLAKLPHNTAVKMVALQGQQISTIQTLCLVRQIFLAGIAAHGWITPKHFRNVKKKGEEEGNG